MGYASRWWLPGHGIHRNLIGSNRGLSSRLFSRSSTARKCYSAANPAISALLTHDFHPCNTNQRLAAYHGGVSTRPCEEEQIEDAFPVRRNCGAVLAFRRTGLEAAADHRRGQTGRFESYTSPSPNTYGNPPEGLAMPPLSLARTSAKSIHSEI